jgi:hypothetical protein
MNRLSKVLDSQILSGAPRTIGDLTLTPRSQAIALHTPVFNWVWHRPLDLVVERAGERTLVPVVDVTRLAQVALLVAALGFAVAGLLARGQKEKHDER